MKTFAWKGNKAQALKGYNDDLIMSMAIGVWLYDGSSDGGAKANAINDAMLAAMCVTSTKHDGNKVETKLSNTKIIPVTQFGAPGSKASVATHTQQIDPMFAWVMSNKKK
jgi:hypothetical protein